MKSDVRGCSTCPKGEEQYETYEYRGKTYYQYEYRDIDGSLYVATALSLEEAREKVRIRMENAK